MQRQSSDNSMLELQVQNSQQLNKMESECNIFQESFTGSKVDIFDDLEAIDVDEAIGKKRDEDLKRIAILVQDLRNFAEDLNNQVVQQHEKVELIESNLQTNFEVVKQATNNLRQESTTFTYN